jgi:hypothetical protein
MVCLVKVINLPKTGSQASALLAILEEMHEIVKCISKDCNEREGTSQCDQIVISTSMVYFHKFFANKLQSIFSIDLFEKYILAATFVFLATKSCNKFISVETLIYAVINKFHSENCENMKEKIFSLEFEILCSFGFDMNFDLPYQNLFEMRNLFKEFKGAQKNYYTFCQWFLNDSFILPLCIYFSPRLIALASIQLLDLNFKVGLFEKVGNILDFEETEQIKKIVTYINLIYSFKKQGKEGVGVSNANNSNNINLNLKKNPQVNAEKNICLNLTIKNEKLQEDIKNLIKA